MERDISFKSINELCDEFFYIPYYQRGYRWSKQQVMDLLNDVWTFIKSNDIEKDEFYCLQPVVVKRKVWEQGDATISGWEVVDGQQRLTTLFIVIKYMTTEMIPSEQLERWEFKRLYTLTYQTREGSQFFLENLKDCTKAEKLNNIDYYYMAQAYETTREWFQSRGQSIKDSIGIIFQSLVNLKECKKPVKLIWYEVDAKVDSIETFRRLNAGKIPLTNAELIKALFLSESSLVNTEEPEKKKIEISILWDLIEERMNNQHYWAFLTNEDMEKYTSKIELLFDIIANKTDKVKDPLHTFLDFYREAAKDKGNLQKLWEKIVFYDQVLYEWYKNRDLYHKIGYLIATGEKLSSLLSVSLINTKSGFLAFLDDEIRKKVGFNLDNLGYDKPSDYERIENVLLLFNIESIRTNEAITEYYSFKHHKSTKWSLEHIHAQNAQGLNQTRRSQWEAWIENHRALMEAQLEERIEDERKEQLKGLLAEIREIDLKTMSWDEFFLLSQKIGLFFSSSEDNNDELHGLGNLALIGQAENSALNNTIFEVKRRYILQMDRDGKYIPICTKRVFLKYYNEKTSQEDYYYWSSEDRKNYLEAIKDVLRRNGYLSGVYKEDQHG